MATATKKKPKAKARKAKSSAPKKARTIASRIRHLEPCEDARKWAKGYTSPAKAWRECQRGDWLLWFLGRVSGPPESDSRSALVLCACECARIALPRFEKRYPNEARVRTCLETAERWARGEATIEELRKARADATYAADAAHSTYAAYAAYAVYAVAVAAESAAAAAAACAAECAANVARANVLAQCADIVRQHYPKPPRINKEFA